MNMSLIYIIIISNITIKREFWLKFKFLRNSNLFPNICSFYPHSEYLKILTDFYMCTIKALLHAKYEIISAILIIYNSWHNPAATVLEIRIETGFQICCRLQSNRCFTRAALGFVHATG